MTTEEAKTILAYDEHLRNGPKGKSYNPKADVPLGDSYCTVAKTGRIKMDEGYVNGFPPSPRDKTVDDLINDFKARANFGYKKYGVTTAERKDIDLRGWLQHGLEEAQDLCVYLKRTINMLDEQNAPKD